MINMIARCPRTSLTSPHAAPSATSRLWKELIPETWRMQFVNAEALGDVVRKGRHGLGFRLRAWAQTGELLNKHVLQLRILSHKLRSSPKTPLNPQNLKAKGPLTQGQEATIWGPERLGLHSLECKSTIVQGSRPSMMPRKPALDPQALNPQKAGSMPPPQAQELEVALMCPGHVCQRVPSVCTACGGFRSI